MTAIEWTTEPRRLGDLKEWSDNPRLLMEHDANELDKSLSRFGLAEPLVINLDNTLIGGHQRRRRLIGLLGADYIADCRVPSRLLTPAEFRELGIRLNRNQGKWDKDILADRFDPGELMDFGFEQKDLGFSLPAPATPGEQAEQATHAAAYLAVGSYRPKWNKKRTCRFLSVRSWRQSEHKAEVESMKKIKADCDPDAIAAIAAELKEAITDMVKCTRQAFVTSAPRGHSKNEQHFATELGRRLADLLGCSYVKVFDDRELKGSSHPRTWATRATIELAEHPAQPICIFVDDIATSGTTVESCATALADYFVLPVVWIYEDDPEG